jgi:hypothetical protein
MPIFPPTGWAHSKKVDQPKFANGQSAEKKKMLPWADQPKSVQEKWASWTMKYEVFGEAVGPCLGRVGHSRLPAHEQHNILISPPDIS